MFRPDWTHFIDAISPLFLLKCDQLRKLLDQLAYSRKRCQSSIRKILSRLALYSQNEVKVFEGIHWQILQQSSCINRLSRLAFDYILNRHNPFLGRWCLRCEQAIGEGHRALCAAYSKRRGSNRCSQASKSSCGQSS